MYVHVHAGGAYRERTECMLCTCMCMHAMYVHVHACVLGFQISLKAYGARPLSSPLPPRTLPAHLTSAPSHPLCSPGDATCIGVVEPRHVHIHMHMYRCGGASLLRAQVPAQSYVRTHGHVHIHIGSRTCAPTKRPTPSHVHTHVHIHIHIGSRTCAPTKRPTPPRST